VAYPTAEQEVALLDRIHRGFDAHQLSSVGLQAVASQESLLEARRAVKASW
jgi:hypothetical protein